MKYLAILILGSFILYSLGSIWYLRRKNNDLDRKYKHVNDLIVQLESQNKAVMENNDTLKAILNKNLENNAYKNSFNKNNINNENSISFNQNSDKNELFEYINNELQKKNI